MKKIICDFCGKEMPDSYNLIKVTVENETPQLRFLLKTEHHLHTECAVRVNNLMKSNIKDGTHK